jgi:FtsH-binding integral membrane protein
MENNLFNSNFSQKQLDISQNISVYLTKVYNWMAIALLITGLVAYFTADSEQLLQVIFGNRILFFGLIIAEVLLVGYIAARIQRLTTSTAISLFLLYSTLNGLTMAFIFMAYTSASISSTFIITAGTFGAMSLYGYFTKKDLTKIGNIAFMGLIGIIIASVVNIFMESSMMYWIITYIGVIIFVALTAYDTQKLKRIAAEGFQNDESMEKSAILGALTLYLDFINLFLFLLRIFGDRK